jgi:dihydroorotate dehydrogenase electron transfer subunit
VLTFGEIQINAAVAPNCFLMSLYASDLAKVAKAGQFIHIKVTEGTYPLLRRPISIHDIDPDTGTISLLYQVRGKGTELLSTKRRGEKLNLLGPLGNGFNLEFSGKKAILVGGGIGVAPLYSLAKSLIRDGKEVRVLIGARTKEMIYQAEKFFDLGCTVQCATDDGSYGEKAFVTELLESALKDEKPDYVYTCGPEVMMTKVVDICLTDSVSGQVSLEAYMGCGIGACLCCTTELVDNSKRHAKVCHDGPVFFFEEVRLNGKG